MPWTGEQGKVKLADSDEGPVLAMKVADECDAAIDLKISWSLDSVDASCWQRPIRVQINPIFPDEKYEPEKYKIARETQEDWETVLTLSRENARVVRDFLDTLIRSPDWRQDDKGFPYLHGDENAK